MEPADNLDITFKGLKEHKDEEGHVYYTKPHSPTKTFPSYRPTGKSRHTRSKSRHTGSKSRRTRKRFPNKVWMNDMLKTGNIKTGGRRKRRTRRASKKRRNNRR